MLLQAAVVALALFFASVSAQTNATTIDPNVVSPQLRASWCNGQDNVCTVLCNKSIMNINCNPTNLTWACLCSNGSTPDIADYTTSLPAFICQESFALCIANHKDDQMGQDNCKNTIESKCGTLDIDNFTAPASTSSAGPSATAVKTSSSTGAGTGTATAATTSSTKSSAAVAAVAIGREYGTGLFAAAMVAALGLL